MSTRNKAFYICFYAEQENKNDYIVFPSAWNKVDYIVSRLIKCGYDVSLLSASNAKKHAKRRKYIISDNEAHYYFSSIGWKNKIWRKITQIWINLQIIAHVLLNSNKNDVVVVYHSMYYTFATKVLKNVFRKKVVLEIEEAYSHTDIPAFKFRKKEDEYLRDQKRYICINELVQEEYTQGRPSVIAYGDYRLCPDYKEHQNADKIKLVYAGVIEQTRNAAFIASDAIQYLPEKYELHIMGFGTKENVAALCEKIEEINERLGKARVFYDGHFSGEEYFRRLQSNDIALSTHIYSASDADSSRYMFSSKILSYLNNNLPVVAQRLECLEKSSVGKILNFYEEATPKNIANAIKNIDLTKEYDSRKIVQKLDEDFINDLKSILC